MQVTLPSFHKEDIDIVCFSLSRWSAPISSPAISLAKELSKHHRVFFIEHPYSIKDVIKERKPPATHTNGNVSVITPPVVYPINFLPEGKIYRRFSKLNNNILLKTLREVISRNNITRYVFINFFDPFFLRSIPADIRPERYVYQCMDDLSQVKYTRRHGVRLEEEIIKSSDLVLCTSRELTNLKSAISPDVHFHPNAADFDLFNKAVTHVYPKPADLKFGNKKIIGFTGSIEYRTDFELLKKIAAYHKDKILFMLGPVSGEEHLETGIDKLPNVIFAGARPIKELPPYLQHFDCCIIPYKINTLTASIYPLKINEYLAAGKPVVATHFSEDIYSFHENAWVVDTHDEFVHAIDEAINGNDEDKKQQRIRAASMNTWEKRVEEFWKLVI
jgi:teichuronic acid biosynthesis glycosyltransferase TuaH